MRNQKTTKGIVLARTDFQEADRIITVLTPDFGKLRLMAKGVRRAKSKLAAGIELFSVSDITFLTGRSEIGTLVSSRLITHYGQIVSDINRTMLAYDFLKRINRLTEDEADQDYFESLSRALSGLNSLSLDRNLTELWLTMQLLKITGHSPNLRTDNTGRPLEAGKKFVFEYDEMSFTPKTNGPFTANHIKLLRLSIGTARPEELLKVHGADKLTEKTLNLAKSMLNRVLGY